METKAKITATITVRHEESMIEECLLAIKDFADEVIVVHDGICNDNTIKIAQKYTSNIIEVPWSGGHPELVRHYGNKKATGDWILVLDVDDRLSDDLKATIKQTIDAPDIDAYSVFWLFHDSKGNPLEHTLVKRKKILFRKEKLYQVGVAHMVGATYGTTKQLAAYNKHQLRESEESHSLLWSIFKKNFKRGKLDASNILHRYDQIPVYNCQLDDKALPDIRKIQFKKQHPALGMLFLPLYSFGYAYFKKDYWKNGWTGFVMSCDVASYHFANCWYLLTKVPLQPSPILEATVSDSTL